jgi:hypothetical protein
MLDLKLDDFKLNLPKLRLYRSEDGGVHGAEALHAAELRLVDYEQIPRTSSTLIAMGSALPEPSRVDWKTHHRRVSGTCSVVKSNFGGSTITSSSQE